MKNVKCKMKNVKCKMRMALFLSVLASCGIAVAGLPDERPLMPPELLARRLLLKGRDVSAGWEEKSFVFGGASGTNELTARIPAASLHLKEFYRFTTLEKSVRGLLGVELHAPMPPGAAAGGIVEMRPEKPFRKYDMVFVYPALDTRVGKVSSNVRFKTEQEALEEAGEVSRELAKLHLSVPQVACSNRIWIAQTRRVAVMIVVMPVGGEWTTGINMIDKGGESLHVTLGNPARFDADGAYGEFPYTFLPPRDNKLRNPVEIADFFALSGKDIDPAAEWTYRMDGSGMPPSKLPRQSMQLLEDYPFTDAEKSLCTFFGEGAELGAPLPPDATAAGHGLFAVAPKFSLWPAGQVQVHTNGTGRIDVVMAATGPVRKDAAMRIASALCIDFLLGGEIKPECVVPSRRWLFQTRRLAFVLTLAENEVRPEMWGITLTLHDKVRFGLK